MSLKILKIPEILPLIISEHSAIAGNLPNGLINKGVSL